MPDQSQDTGTDQGKSAPPSVPPVSSAGRTWERDRIAWCHHCGNVSVDGINFHEEEPGSGWLRCLACGYEGQFSFRREPVQTAEPSEEPQPEANAGGSSPQAIRGEPSYEERLAESQVAHEERLELWDANVVLEQRIADLETKLGIASSLIPTAQLPKYREHLAALSITQR